MISGAWLARSAGLGWAAAPEHPAHRSGTATTKPKCCPVNLVIVLPSSLGP